MPEGPTSVLEIFGTNAIRGRVSVNARQSRRQLGFRDAAPSVRILGIPMRGPDRDGDVRGRQAEGHGPRPHDGREQSQAGAVGHPLRAAMRIQGSERKAR